MTCATQRGRSPLRGVRGRSSGVAALRQRVPSLLTAAVLVAGLSACSGGGLPGTSGTTSGSGSSGSPATVQRRALPNSVGKGLKYAVDAARAAGFPSFSTHDASGRMRSQLLYTDWKVCFQTPPAGSHPVSTKVDFGVVKLAESCPSADRGLVTVTAGAVMPDLRGRSVRYADDVLGSSASIRFTTTGGGDAVVLVDSNWQVCKQTPEPGRPYNGVPVTLVVAKYSDGGCPSS